MQREQRSFVVRFSLWMVAIVALIGAAALGITYVANTASQAQLEAEVERARAVQGRFRAVEDALIAVLELEPSRWSLAAAGDSNAGPLAQFRWRIEEFGPGSTGPITPADLEGLSKLAEEYRQQALRLAESQRGIGSDPDQGARYGLARAAEAVEDALRRIEQARPREAFAALRRLESSALTGPSSRLIEDARMRMDELQQALAPASITPQQRRDVVERLGSYQREFQSVLEASSVTTAEQRRFDEIRASARAQVEALSRRADAHTTATRQQLASGRETMTQRFDWAIALVFLLVPAIAYFVGRGTSNPLTRVPSDLARRAGLVDARSHAAKPAVAPPAKPAAAMPPPPAPPATATAQRGVTAPAARVALPTRPVMPVMAAATPIAEPPTAPTRLSEAPQPAAEAATAPETAQGHGATPVIGIAGSSSIKDDGEPAMPDMIPPEAPRTQWPKAPAMASEPALAIETQPPTEAPAEEPVLVDDDPMVAVQDEPETPTAQDEKSRKPSNLLVKRLRKMGRDKVPAPHAANPAGKTASSTTATAKTNGDDALRSLADQFRAIVSGETSESANLRRNKPRKVVGAKPSATVVESETEAEETASAGDLSALAPTATATSPAPLLAAADRVRNVGDTARAIVDDFAAQLAAPPAGRSLAAPRSSIDEKPQIKASPRAKAPRPSVPAKKSENKPAKPAATKVLADPLGHVTVKSNTAG